MDDIKEVFGRIHVAMVRFSHTLESKLKTLLHQLNEGLKKLKQNKEDEQKQMYQDKLLLLFRKTLSDLMKNWGAQESEETSNSIKELVKLIFWCAKKEIVLVKDALSFSEDFCDMLSVNDLREFIDTFESSIHKINYLSEQDSNYPLKICNVIFKKLTRTYDTRLRGELHIFLSKILPICHASGLKSKICTEITALLENESDIAKNQNIQGNQMEIEEEKSQADNITYSNKDFYKKFWTLQKYFQNPFCLSTNDELLDIEKSSSATCSDNMEEEEEVEEGEEKMIESKKVKAVCSAIQLVLDRFNQNPVFEKREPNIKPYIKYLTTYSLLEKQLCDPFFRKIWLLQALLFFYALQNKTKDLEIKNIDSEMALIKTTEEKVKKTFIQLHENLKEEINFEKLDLFFIDEKIWVERKDMLPRQNKDEKFNFKNPCDKTREMIDYYQKSILVDKKDNQQKTEFTFDSHKMLQQKQFAEMEAFKKKIIQDCCKTGGNSITEESNMRQILGKEFYFPIKTSPIQKSVGYYINQVIDQLKDSTSEKLVDDPIFVTKAMRASFRFNLNWAEKDKETLKDLENFAKEFENKEVDKLAKQDKEKERDKSSNKESQIQPEQVQAEDQKKSKIDKTEKSSRSNNENEENPQADQSRNANSSGSNFSSRQEEKSKSQPQKIQNQNEAKQTQEQQKNVNSSSNQNASTVEKTVQPTNLNNISKSTNDNEQRGKYNDERHKKDEKNDRQGFSNESSKTDSKIDEPKNSRQDNEKEKIISQENNRQQADEKVNLKANDEQINNERPRQTRQESNFSDSKNEEVKPSSNKEEKSRNEDKSERNNQNPSQKVVSDDKHKSKVDSKQKEERQQIDEENRRFQPSEENRKTSKDESKRFYNQEDNRKNIDENRKNNEDQVFDKNDNQKQLQGNNNSNQSQNNQNSSKNNNQQQQNTSSSSSSSKNIENQKNEPKQGDESNKFQSQNSNNNNSQGSGNFSNMNNNSNRKPQLNLQKNDPQIASQVSTGNSTGGRAQVRSRSKEKQSNSYSSGSGSRSNTNNTNNNQYNSGNNNNSSGNNSNYNTNNSYQQGGNNQYNNSYNSSKYNQRDDSKQNSGYGSQNNNYNQGNYNKGNNNNSNNYSNKRDYNNNNSQYDNTNNSNSNNKRENYDRKNFQNSNYYNNNRGNEYEPGPNKRQKN
ncbi:hypothetical protein ABPG72_003197 [Tetrahymena utriculariae]